MGVVSGIPELCAFAAARAVSAVCAVASAPLDVAAVESSVAVAVAVRAVPPLAVASPFAVVFGAVPLVPALAASIVLKRRLPPDSALAVVPVLLALFALEVVELLEFATCLVAPVALAVLSVPVAEPEWEFPSQGAVPVAVAEVCCDEVGCAEVCCVWGGLVEAFGAGAGVLASSQAAKGVSPVSSLGAEGCKRADDGSETAATMSDATLGILGTGVTPRIHISYCLPATAGPPRRARGKTCEFNSLGALSGESI